MLLKCHANNRESIGGGWKNDLMIYALQRTCRKLSYAIFVDPRCCDKPYASGLTYTLPYEFGVMERKILTTK